MIRCTGCKCNNRMVFQKNYVKAYAVGIFDQIRDAVLLEELTITHSV